MHPLVAVGLVFLTGLAWMGTVLTLLIALAKSRQRAPAEAGNANQSEDADSGYQKASRLQP
jgi:hypothetical protein